MLGASWPLMQEASGGAAQEGSIAVGFRKQLLVDDYLIAEKSNVTRELGKVTQANNGQPLLIYRATDDDGFEFEAALPIEAAPAQAPGGEISVGPAPTGRALKFVHRGAFDGMETTYESIANYIEGKGLTAEELFIEEFVTDPLTSKQDALVINVYVPLKK